MKAFLTFICFLLLVACAHRSSTSATLTPPGPLYHVEIGHWENPFQGNPNLAGVHVQQFTDCSSENWRYKGKHPAMVVFYYWDGRVRQLGYEPDGTVHEDFWWPDSLRLKPEDAAWSNVDFTCGSDPAFEHHADPRK